MTEKEKQELINIVHRTVLGFFDTSLDEERYLTETEKTLLEVNKAICNSIQKMPTIEQPSCVFDEEASNALMDIILKEGEVNE